MKSRLLLALVPSCSLAVVAGCGSQSSATGSATRHAQSQSGWQVQHRGAADIEFSGVTFGDLQHGWVLGSADTVLATVDGGTTWVPQSAGLYAGQWQCVTARGRSAWLAGSSMRAPERCAVASTHDAGAHWQTQTLSSTGTINMITFADGCNGWAFGSDGKRALAFATKDGGRHWLRLRPGPAVFFEAVQFVSSKDGWAIGTDLDAETGAVMATTDGGRHWTAQAAGHGLAGIDCLSFANRRDGWVADDSGNFFSTIDAGRDWVERTTAAMRTADIRAITFVDGSHGWAVGGGSAQYPPVKGTIWATSDGGGHWALQDRSGYPGLTGVNFVGRDHGWAAGEAQTIVATASAGLGSGTAAPAHTSVLVTADRGRWVKVTALAGPASVRTTIRLSGGDQKIIYGSPGCAVTLNLLADDGADTLYESHEITGPTTDWERLAAGRYSLSVQGTGHWSVVLYERR